MNHHYELIHQSLDRVEWKCPACNRHIAQHFNGHLKMIDEGDSEASHGSVGIGTTLSFGIDTTERH